MRFLDIAAWVDSLLVKFRFRKVSAEQRDKAIKEIASYLQEVFLQENLTSNFVDCGLLFNKKVPQPVLQAILVRENKNIEQKILKIFKK